MQRHEIAEALRGTAVSAWHHFESIGSTNTEAQCWADRGAPDFALVLAEQQTSGRGRFDRRWITSPGASLALSLILRPTPDEVPRLALFAPLCGIAVHETVQRVCGLSPQIKWPNDVLLKGQKFCGILVESSWKGSQPAAVIMGIGMNINRGSIPPPELRGFPATSLEAEYGSPVDRAAILRELLFSIHAWRGKLGTPVFMQYWEEHLAFKGQQVRIENSERPLIIGKIKGINELGQLLLINDSGEMVPVTVGDIHLRPVQPDDPGGNNVG